MRDPKKQDIAKRLRWLVKERSHIQLGVVEDDLLEAVVIIELLRARPSEAVERDAARYRWLKTNHLQTGTDSWIRTGEDLEDAIDAAMSSSRSVESK